MARNNRGRVGFGRTVSPSRRSATPLASQESQQKRRQRRARRWHERFRRFALSTWQSNRIMQGVCDLFRSGAETARAIRAATGSQVVSAGYGRQLRMEGLEARQMLTATPLTGVYVQDFDDLLPIPTTDGLYSATVLPPGWEIAESDTNADTNLTAGAGSSATGDTYLFGSTGSNERALGGLQSGTLVPTIGASFTNDTGAAITSLAVAYTGEQWRLGNAGRTDRLDFQYSTDATSLTTGTWTDFDSLDFTAPTTSGGIGAQVGNAAANRTAVASTISFLNISDGATFFIRWNSFDASGSDDGLAVDDFLMVAGPATTTYVDDAWIGLANGEVIDDADAIAAGNQPAIVGTNAFATIQHGIDAVADGGTVVVNAGTYSESPQITNGKTLHIVGDTTLAGEISAIGATLQVDALLASGTIAIGAGSDGGTLRGSGTIVAPDIFLNMNSKLAAGDSPGTLTVEGDVIFQSGSQFEVEINGSAAGQHDRLVVNNGDVTIHPDASLIVTVGFTPIHNLPFSILQQNGPGDILGSFDYTPVAGFQYSFASHVHVLAAIGPQISNLTITPSPVIEGGAVTASGMIYDNETGATFTLTLNWGDGTANQAIALGAAPINAGGIDWDPATGLFAISHTYADDNPTASPTNNNSVSVVGLIDSNGVSAGLHNGIGFGLGLSGDVSNTDFNNATSSNFFGNKQVSSSIRFGPSSGTAHSHGDPVDIFVDLHDPTTGTWNTVFSDTLTNSETFSFAALTLNFAPQVIDQVRLRSNPGQNQTFHGWNGLQVNFPSVSVAAVTVNNEAPSIQNVQLSSQSINEEDSVTVTGTFTDPALGVPTESFSGTAQWSDGAVTPLSIDSSGNFSTTRAFANYEPAAANEFFTVTISISDDDGGSDSETSSTLTVVAINDHSPIFSAGLTQSLSVAENSGNLTVVGSAAATDADVPADTLTYDIIDGNPNGGFAIDPSSGQITIADASQLDLDFENGALVATLTVEVSDGTHTAEQEVTVSVADENEAPTALALDNNSVAENSAVASPVGTLSTSDVDAGDTFTYELVDGFGDNSLFSLAGAAGDTLVTAATFDFETQGPFSVRVRSTDSGGLTTEETFTINITDVNEAPTALLLSNNTLDENLPVGSTVGTFSTTDVDAGDAFTYELVDGFGDNSLFGLAGAGGDTLVTAATLDFEAQSTYSIRVRTTDSGGLPFEQTFTINISDVNEAPTADAGGPYTITENQELVLDARGSSDPEGAIKTYTWTQVGGPFKFAGRLVPGGGTQVEWDLDDDGSVDVTTPDARLTLPPYSLPTSVVPQSAGTYEFELIVTDETDVPSSAASATVTVNTALPGISVAVGDVDGDGIDDITIASTDGDNRTFTVDSEGPTLRLTENGNTVDLPSIDAAGKIFVQGGTGDDTLTIDFSGGDPISAGGLYYEGGGGSDELVITGTPFSFDTTIYRYTSPNDGSIDLDGSLITYTGLEPVTTNIAADVVELVFTGASETITVTDAGGGMTTVDSTLGELTTFANPTDLLSITATNGTDVVSVSSLAADYAALEIFGDDVTDVVNFSGGVALAADNNLTVSDVGTIGSGGSIDTSGSGAVSLTAMRNIALSGSVTTVDGDVTLTANQDLTPVSGTFVGVDFNNNVVIASATGGITVTGRGGDIAGGPFQDNAGVRLQSGAIVGSGTSGTVQVEGTGGSVSNNDNSGVTLTTASLITSGGGAVSLVGVAGGGPNSAGIRLVSNGAITTAANGGDISLVADSMSFAGTSLVSADAASSITLRNLTSGNDIHLGAADSTGVLGLTDAELDVVTAGSIIIGDSVETDDLVVAAAIGHAATNLTLKVNNGGSFSANSSLSLDSGVLDVDAPTAFLNADLSATTLDGSAGTVSVAGSGSIQDGIDIAAAVGTVNVAAGTYTGNVSATAKQITLVPGNSPGQVTIDGDFTLDSDDTLEMEIDGLTPGADHDQWIANGIVTLGGATLDASGTIDAVAGDAIVLIDNDGVDQVAGTFDGLDNGDTLVIGSDTFAIFYSGGDGNDVVLVQSNALGEPTVVYVDDDWSGESEFADPDGPGGAAAFGFDAFATITDAVAAVANSGTIIVHAGAYNESVSIGKDLSLLGAGASDVTLDGGAISTPLTIENGADVLVEGFTITGGIFGIDIDGADLTLTNSIVGGGSAMGVLVDNGGSVEIQDSLLDGSGLGTGVAVVDGSATITGSILQNRTDGVIVGAGGAATLFNNDLSYNFGSYAIQANPAAGVVDASGNWWGSNDEATVAGKALGSVDFTPYLDHGANNAGGVGFDGDFSHLHVTALGEQTSGGRIQEGVDLVDAGGIVEVHAGTFDEQVVINKSLTLDGQGNSTVIAPSSAAVLTTIYNTGVQAGAFFNNINLAGVVQVSGVGTAGVTIRDLKIDAENVTALPAGAAQGVGLIFGETAGLIQNVTIEEIDSIPLTTRSHGMWINAVGGPAVTVEVDTATVDGYARTGILSRGNELTVNIHDSIITGPGAIGPHNVPNGITLIDTAHGSVTDNIISAGHYTGASFLAGGILLFGAADGVMITGNEVFDYDDGIILNSTNMALVDDNHLHGNVKGIRVEAAASNNTISNNTIEDSSLFGIDFGTTAAGGTNTISGNTITDSTTGINVEGGTLTIGAGNTVTGGTTGILFKGATVGLTGLDLDGLSISGVSGDYITLADGAFDNLNLDGTGLTLDGVAVSSMTSAQRAAAGTKITDELDDNTLGLVVLAANTIDVASVDETSTTPSATDNDYTRIKNAIEAVGDNWTINLLGTFDWTETNANASWALGNNGVAGGGDDYSIVVPQGLENVTLTAGMLGDATIQGPGDLDTVNLESFLEFAGSTSDAVNNQEWTISNLQIYDFDLSIGMFSGGSDVSLDQYDGTTITNNHIRIANDLNSVDAPVDVNQNIGIHYAFGDGQTISGNLIDIPGDGVSDPSATPTNRAPYSSVVGIQSNTNGAAYDDLMITGNTIRVLNAQNAANPQRIVGIWENGNAIGLSDITVSGNQFLNVDENDVPVVGNDPTLNFQQAFWVTSHSGVGGTVTYSNNTVTGASVGIKWAGDPEVPAQDYTGRGPVNVTGNILNDVETGILVQNNGSAILSGNTLTNSGSMDGVGIGVDVRAGSIVSIDGSVVDNEISGFATGILSAGTLFVIGNDASIEGNAVGIDLTGGAATIDGNNIHDNGIGVRITDASATLTDNTIHDNTVGIDVRGASTLDLVDGSVDDNDQNGLLVIGDGSVQAITVDGTTFTGNALNGPVGAGQGDITLFEFGGPAGMAMPPSTASFTNVVIASANPDYAIQVSGRNGDLGDFLALNDGSTAQVSFNNVDITGSQQRMAMLIQQYADLSGFSFNDVTFDSTAQGGLVIFDAAGTMNLGNTTFHDSYTGGDGPGNGTGFDIATSLTDIDATHVDFLDSFDIALDKNDLDDNFAIEDRVAHAIDAEAPFPVVAGLIDWVGSGTYDDAVFVTTESYVPGPPVALSTSPSIQRGIDAAESGWTVYVQDGAYTEQLDIAKDLSLVGQSQSGTIVESPTTLSLDNSFVFGGTHQSVIAVRSDSAVTIRDLTVDGAGQGAQVVPGNDFHGIGIHNSDVTIDTVTVTGVRDATLTGIQRGRAIFAGNDSGLHTVSVQDSIVNDYQKNGIDLRGAGLTVDVDGNTITGSGPTGTIAQNGIVVLGGAAGSVTGNTVEDHDYTGPDTATGILLFSSGLVTVSGNFLNNNETGLAATGSSTAAKVEANDLTGNFVGLLIDNDALVDAGGGSLSSTGGNILTGYTGAAGNYAIENFNEDASGNVDVFAQNNSFGSTIPAVIEQVVFHTVDDPQYTEVLFTPAVAPPNTPVPPSVVFVDDDWDGTAIGADADSPAGGTLGNGEAFGYDQFATIQDAIDAVAVGGTIYVYGGTYAESIVVDKSLDLLSELSGVDARGRSAANEAIITSAVADETVALVTIAAADVTIDGFTIDGDAGILGGVTLRDGLTVSNAARGIAIDGDNAQVLNNRVQNFYRRGIQSWVGFAPAPVGGVVSQNEINSIGVAAPDGFFSGDGILAFSPLVEVTDNDVNDATTGITFIQIYPTVPTSIEISGNAINATNGIALNEIGAATTMTVSDNTVITGDGGVGLLLWTVDGAVAIDDSLGANSFTGTGAGDVGVYGWDGTANDAMNVTISGGSISGYETGVRLTNEEDTFGPALSNATLTLSGVDISTAAGGVGVLVEDTVAGSFAVTVNIQDDSDITTGGTGTAVLVSGASASANVSGNDSSIHGNAVGVDVDGGSATVAGNHIYDNGIGIQFRNGGTGSVTGNNFDDAADDNDTDLLMAASAGAVTIGDGNEFAGDDYFIDNQTSQDFDLTALPGTTYEGLTPGGVPANLEDNFRIEDLMFHGPDNGTAGVITWVADTLFVTSPGSGENDESIQNAVDVADQGGDTVYVEAGIYSENIAISKDINLIGEAGGTTLRPFVAGDVVAISGSGFGDDETVRIENFDFDGLAGVGIRGISVSSGADFENLTVSGGSFTGFNNQAIIVSGNSITGTSVANVELTDLDFSNNGLAGFGGTGDVVFEDYNANATLTNLMLEGSATATMGARLGIQFRGIAAPSAMGMVTLDNVDVSGDYRTQMIGFHRYSDVDDLTFTSVALGGADSAITGTFGASLRFDAVGSGSVAVPAVVDLGDTLFRGLDPASAQRHELEFAPDNATTFLRANATGTSWTIGGVDIAAADLDLAEAFAVEDRILHYVDKLHPIHGGTFGPYKGFADIQAGQAFIGDDVDTGGLVGDGSIQRGVNIVAAGGTVNAEAGSFTEAVIVDKHVKIIGAGSGSTVLTQPVTSNIITITASGASDTDRLTLAGMQIMPSGTGSHGVLITGAVSLEHLLLDDVTFTGTDPAGPNIHEIGLRIMDFADVDDLVVQNSLFEFLTHGMITEKHLDIAGTTNVTNVLITDTAFENNNWKGFYAEKLSDATFTNVVAIGNGNDAGYNSGSGIEINLKGNNATYENLIFNNLTVTNNGNAAHATPVGGGLQFKARGSGVDAALYTANPASLTNVQVNGGTFDGNRTAIRIGEPGQANTSPTGVLIDGVTISNSLELGVHVIGGEATIQDATLTDNPTGILVQGAGRAIVSGNPVGIAGGDVGIAVDGGTALVENTVFDLTDAPEIGVLIQNDGVADLGQDGGSDFTGLGISAGGNDFSAYTTTATAASGAIVNLNSDAVAGRQGAPPDVTAFANTWAVATPNGIENVVYHDSDVSTLGFVDFAAFEVVTVNVDDNAIDEGDEVEVTGSFSNVPQAHTVTIVWGDSSPNTVINLAAGDFDFNATHTYEDDADGPAENTTNYPISITITEDATSQSIADNSLSVDVSNVAPTVMLVGPASANDGQTLSYTFTTSDPGSDTFPNFVINGGDYGSVSNTVFDSMTGAGSFDVTFDGPPGTSQSIVSVTVEDDDEEAGSDSIIVTISDTLQVIDIQTNDSGFDVTFNRALDFSELNLYDHINPLMPGDMFRAPDVVVHASVANEDVDGSVVWNAATNTLSWVKTGGPLTSDNYSITLVSGSDAFQDQFGNTLDGNGDFVEGDDYQQAFNVVVVGGTPIVSVPDFARGPGQGVDLTANSTLDTTLPVRATGTNVQGVNFELVYDTTLLTINPLAVTPALAGWNVVANQSVSMSGIATLTVAAFATTPAFAFSGTESVVNLGASVPSGAPYGATQVLRLQNSEVNDDDAQNDYAIQKAAFPGDANGSGILPGSMPPNAYTGEDASLIARVVVGSDGSTGFDAYPFVDPTIVGDASGNGGLNAFDASLVAQEAAGFNTPEVPDETAPGMGGVAAFDPELSIPDNIVVEAGEQVTVPVDITIETSVIGIISATFTVEYDTDVLDFITAQLGDDFDSSGWTITPNEPSNGMIQISMFNTSPSGNNGGMPQELAELIFDVLASAPEGQSTLNIEPVDPNESGLVWTEDDGSVLVAPPLAGDYNRNGVVDTADYILWRKYLNDSVPAYSSADGDGDGQIEQDDYDVWTENFGDESPGSGSGSGSSGASDDVHVISGSETAFAESTASGLTVIESAPEPNTVSAPLGSSTYVTAVSNEAPPATHAAARSRDSNSWRNAREDALASLSSRVSSYSNGRLRSASQVLDFAESKTDALLVDLAIAAKQDRDVDREFAIDSDQAADDIDAIDELFAEFDHEELELLVQ
jgi:parallel beta-helix repeat protein